MEDNSILPDAVDTSEHEIIGAIIVEEGMLSYTNEGNQHPRFKASV